MELTLSAFKKASKRYASSAGKDLSAAQEEFASFFGFKDFHAAQALLARKPAAAPVVAGDLAPPPPVVWSRFSPAEFFAIVDSIKKDLDGNEPDAWARRAFEMFDAVVLSHLADATQPITTAKLYAAVQFDALEHRYSKLCERYGPASSGWPRAHRRLARYLEIGIPGISVPKLRARHRQSDTCHEQHGYLLAHALLLIDQLELVEEMAEEFVRSQGAGEAKVIERLRSRSFLESLAPSEKVAITTQ